MLKENDIIYIFKILLNKNMELKDTYKYRNYDLKTLKNQIYNSKEFKDFRSLYLDKIRVIVEKEIGINHTGINFEKFWKELIKFNYDIEKFKSYIINIINNVREQYRDFYIKYFLFENEITSKELAKILRMNCSVEFYISTSDFFMEKCDIVIENLLEKI